MSKPFIKWAGGKTQLLKEIISRMPSKYNHYYEPFLGGGAVFFAIAPKNAIVNDINQQLMNTYAQIRDNTDKLLKQLEKDAYQFNHTEDKDAYYYVLRDRYNQILHTNTLESAALFIELNKTCFNGLYRTNAKGFFNVPSGHKKKASFYDVNNLKEVAKSLQNVTCTNTDFEEVIDKAQKGDFVFIDSPYYGTFDTYQAGGFSEENHRRLAQAVKRAHKRGVYCMITNSNTDFIKDLYQEFHIDIVQVQRNINSDATNRKGEEVIITTY